MRNVLPDGGFETVPTTWTLGTACVVGTAEIDATVRLVGLRSLKILSNSILGGTSCGYAQRSAPTVPGRSYRLRAWILGTGNLTRTTFIRVDGVVRITATGLSSGIWKQFTSAWFTVAGASALVKVEMPVGAAPLAFRWFDEITLEYAPPPDDAAVSRGSGVGATASPIGIGGIVSPLSIRGRVTKG